MNFRELEDWIMTDEGISVRIIKGGDINNPNDRVAYISNAPYVKVSGRLCHTERHQPTEIGWVTYKIGNKENKDGDIWINGPFKTTIHRKNTNARDWCDQFIKLLGFN